MRFGISFSGNTFDDELNLQQQFIQIEKKFSIP